MHGTSNGPKSLQTTKRLRTRSSTFWSDSYNGVMGYEPGCLFPLLNGQQTEAGGLKSQLTQGQNIVRRWGLVSDISPLSLGVYHVHPVLHSRRLIEHENGTINQSICTIIEARQSLRLANGIARTLNADDNLYLGLEGTDAPILELPASTKWHRAYDRWTRE